VKGGGGDMVQTTALCTVTDSAGATEHGVSAYAEQRKLSAAGSRQPDRKKYHGPAALALGS
jgi:hypothetical protein